MPMTDERAAQSLLALFGTDSISEVIELVHAERQGMRELHDTNVALKIYNRRLRLVLGLVKKVLDFVLGEGSMFLSAKAISAAEEAQKQYQLVERTVAASKELCEM